MKTEPPSEMGSLLLVRFIEVATAEPMLELPVKQKDKDESQVSPNKKRKGQTVICPHRITALSAISRADIPISSWRIGHIR